MRLGDSTVFTTEKPAFQVKSLSFQRFQQGFSVGAAGDSPQISQFRDAAMGEKSPPEAISQEIPIRGRGCGG
jgi:hypothetical protein